MKNAVLMAAFAIALAINASAQERSYHRQQNTSVQTQTTNHGTPTYNGQNSYHGRTTTTTTTYGAAAANTNYGNGYHTNDGRHDNGRHRGWYKQHNRYDNHNRDNGRGRDDRGEHRDRR